MGARTRRGKVDDDKSLPEKKDGDKDPIIKDPKVDTGGNKVLKEEDPKVDDTGVSKELLEECLPLDDAMHKAQFLGDKDPPIGVDVNEQDVMHVLCHIVLPTLFQPFVLSQICLLLSSV
ncbi:hypothetical protein GOP47_0029456 [Adiantum capillus-veneris]|nr:hypothetical protein GOP47_0029456 [Adiantum capillus-veneris]